MVCLWFTLTVKARKAGLSLMGDLCQFQGDRGRGDSEEWTKIAPWHKKVPTLGYYLSKILSHFLSLFLEP